MARALILAILAVGFVFVFLTAVIAVNKLVRELREGWRRRRRRDLEHRVLAYAHGEEASLLPALGGRMRRRDRVVMEETLLDHAHRVRGVEKERLGRALDELGLVRRWLGQLRARRWWHRATAAEKLGIAGAARAVGPLVVLLEDSVYEVRLRAAKALGLLGGRAAVKPLIQALSEPNRWSTIRIADILTQMGGSVVEEIIGEWTRMNRHAKLAALDILGRIRSIHASVWLRLRLTDFDADVRARACHAIGAIGDPDSTPALTAALRDANWPVRAMAAKALGRLRAASAIPDLCAALRDREWWVRANAAEALKGMGEPGAGALEKMLDDPDTYARHQAVRALQETGAFDRSVERLASSSPVEREEAAAMLRRFARAGQTGRLAEISREHPDAEVRRAVDALLTAADVKGAEA
jgi:HEAT repeat protein